MADSVTTASLRALIGLLGVKKTSTTTGGLYKLQGGVAQSDIDVRDVVNAIIDALAVGTSVTSAALDVLFGADVGRIPVRGPSGWTVITDTGDPSLVLFGRDGDGAVPTFGPIPWDAPPNIGTTTPVAIAHVDVLKVHTVAGDDADVMTFGATTYTVTGSFSAGAVGQPMLRLTGTPAADFAVTVDLRLSGWVLVHNLTAKVATVAGASGTGFTVAAGQARLAVSDGTNWYAVT